MTGRTKRAAAAPGPPRARNSRSRQRQRQRLIDACISALHIYGPSRTTVEKVVSIAKMSPGIVRFYFDSKAAMLVASLQFLAAEFEERLMIPVAKRKASPVAALELMVDLYLDPDIASPRKVSVWYAFWGEASSRQEYYDICGQKDESFAALVRELIGSLIVESEQPQLDPDGVALGLIGVLEILWQDFAFRTERDIDRPAAKRRCMAYLRSIFPGRFPGADPAASRAQTPRPMHFSGRAYADARLHAQERDRLFQQAWAVVGHESQVGRPGEFLAIDTGADRVLVVRDASGTLQALRNSCVRSPHMLVSARGGRFDDGIDCRLHGLHFSLAGRSAAAAGTASAAMNLTALELATVGGLLFVRSPAREGAFADRPRPDKWFDAAAPDGLTMLGDAMEIPVEADWKVLVEQWLEATRMAPQAEPRMLAASVVWHVAAALESGWSARRYAKLMDCSPHHAWRRQFMWPNQLVESRPDGVSVIQAIPTAPGRSLLRRQDYTLLPPDDDARAVLQLARRLGPYARRATLAAAESVQTGIVAFGYEAAAGGTTSAAAWFRDRLLGRIPAMARDGAPTDP
jgi:TetR/AcrR family transcriptional repressor of bet genes